MMLSIYMCCTVLSCSVWLCDPMDCSPPPLTMGFSRQEYWSGLWCPPPGYLPNPGIKTQVSRTAGRFFTFCATRGARVFIYAKVGSQETPGVTGKFGLRVQNEAGQRLIEFCQENALKIANTLFQQHEKTLHMDITRWPTLKSDWLYYLQPKMEKFYTVSKNKTGS